MHEILDTPDQNIVGIRFSGTLTEDDYEETVPFLEDQIEKHTTVRLFFEMDDVDGWEPEPLWEDWTFDLRHARDADKIAVVGDAPWETWMTKMRMLFLSADVRFFETDDRDDAWSFLRGEMDVPGIGPGSVPEPEAGAQDDGASDE